MVIKSSKHKFMPKPEYLGGIDGLISDHESSAPKWNNYDAEDKAV